MDKRKHVVKAQPAEFFDGEPGYSLYRRAYVIELVLA